MALAAWNSTFGRPTNGLRLILHIPAICNKEDLTHVKILTVETIQTIGINIRITT